jgi:hypothetical protein
MNAITLTSTQRFVLETLVRHGEPLTSDGCAAQCARRLDTERGLAARTKMTSGESTKVVLRTLAKLGLVSQIRLAPGPGRGRVQMWKRRWCVEYEALARFRRGEEQRNRAADAFAVMRETLAALDDDSESSRLAFQCGIQDMRGMLTQIDRVAYDGIYARCAAGQRDAVSATPAAVAS